MNKTLTHLAAFFILSKQKRRAFRKKHLSKPPQTILKRIYEVMDKVGEKNISLELFTLILKTPQIDETKLDKTVCEKWWATIPDGVKKRSDEVVLKFFNYSASDEGGTVCA